MPISDAVSSQLFPFRREIMKSYLHVASLFTKVAEYIRFIVFNCPNILAATKQLYEWFSSSVRLSVCHTSFTMSPSSDHHEIFRSYYQWQKWGPCKRSRSEVKGEGHRGQYLWRRNYAQSFILLRRGALLCFNVILQIWRSHGTKYRRFWPVLSVSGLQLQFDFTHSFEMMPCCFLRASIKFQGSTGWKIHDLNPTWVRLLGWLQISIRQTCCLKYMYARGWKFEWYFIRTHLELFIITFNIVM